MLETKIDRYGLKQYVLNIEDADNYSDLKKALIKDLNMICETIDRNKSTAYYPHTGGGMAGSD